MSNIENTPRHAAFLYFTDAALSDHNAAWQLEVACSQLKRYGNAYADEFFPFLKEAYALRDSGCSDADAQALVNRMAEWLVPASNRNWRSQGPVY
jgi:hypothetical protein